MIDRYYTATIYSCLCRHHQVTNRLPMLTILQLVFIWAESEGEKSVPVLLCGDWVLDMSEDCITRRVVDTEMQWLVFCYD